jgi:hypothetical protein
MAPRIWRITRIWGKARSLKSVSPSQPCFTPSLARRVASIPTPGTFVRCLENAFWHFGGVPQRLVLDNLRAAVTKADWFDPELNPKFRSFGQHYGLVLLPTKPRTPRHKGKIERGVDYVQENAAAWPHICQPRRAKSLLAAVRTAPEQDAVGPAVAAGTHRRDPADRVARQKQQIDAFVAHLLDAAKLANVPVTVNRSRPSASRSRRVFRGSSQRTVMLFSAAFRWVSARACNSSI